MFPVIVCSQVSGYKTITKKNPSIGNLNFNLYLTKEKHYLSWEREKQCKTLQIDVLYI